MSQTPTVPTGSPTRALDSPLSERLFASRTILVFGEIKTQLAETVCAELFALAAISDDPIRMVLHSPGGHVEAGDAIHDVIRFVAPEVHILGTGWVASAGALIYAAAERGRRFALPNTRFLLHQPLGGVQGRASDIDLEVAQIVSIRARLNGIFARATGQSVATITADTERNFWMTAAEARAYGLVGTIVERAADLPSQKR